MKGFGSIRGDRGVGMALDEIPSEVPELPRRPCFYCCEHGCHSELLHALLGRLMVLESRVARLEEKE